MESQRGDGIPDDTLAAVCREPNQFSAWNPSDLELPDDAVDVFESLRGQMHAMDDIVQAP